MSKHTPAPWNLNYDPVTDRFEISRQHVHGPFIYIQRQEGQSRAETEANATLAVAAPEMMDALKGLHGALARMIDKHDPDSIEAEWLQHSHEALLKAEGRQVTGNTNVLTDAGRDRVVSGIADLESSEDLPPTRMLTCCCCSEPTLGRQWWNRDKGFGLCPWCADRIAEKESPEEMSRSYGERGVHYDVQEEK